ncbi:MAG: NAD-dependent epimerase/dehydratase family protein [Phycisphaerae bacterium]
MPIFITGGTGFLGVNLVRELVARGHKVRLLVRPGSSRVDLTSDLIEFAAGDVTDPASIRRAVDGCCEVYHLAAWVQVSPWGRRAAWQVNVEGTRTICSAALSAGVRRLVHTSSIATIAAGTLDEPADEAAPWNLRAAHVPYYETKLEAEKVVLEHVERGLDAVIVNPTYLVGPWDVKPSAGRMLIAMATGRLRVHPKDGGINFVDVRRAVAGHLLAMDHGRSGQRYILGGENLSFGSFAARVDSVTNASIRRWALPHAVAYLPAAVGSLGGRLFPDVFRDVNLSVLHSAYLEHFVSSAKACRELSYKTAAIDRAIEDALGWFVDHGYMIAPAGWAPGDRSQWEAAAKTPPPSVNQAPAPSPRSAPPQKAADRRPEPETENARTPGLAGREPQV